jgi:hypothetical protein
MNKLNNTQIIDNGKMNYSDVDNIKINNSDVDNSKINNSVNDDNSDNDNSHDDNSDDDNSDDDNSDDNSDDDNSDDDNNDNNDDNNNNNNENDDIYNYIYLIEKYDINKNKPVYKFGKSTRNIFHRLKEHCLTSKTLLIIDVIDCNIIEKKILKILNNDINIIKRLDIGNEYFYCKSKIYLINIIINNIYINNNDDKYNNMMNNTLETINCQWKKLIVEREKLILQINESSNNVINKINEDTIKLLKTIDNQDLQIIELNNLISKNITNPKEIINKKNLLNNNIKNDIVCDICNIFSCNKMKSLTNHKRKCKKSIKIDTK